MEVRAGYKQTEVGVIPSDWKVRRLGDICGRVTTGKLDANAMVASGEYPFFTCAREHYWIDEFAFDADALLVSGNGANVGYVHHYTGKFNAYQRTYVLTDFDAEILYLRLFMDRYLQNRLRTEVNAGNTPYITMGTLTDMSVALPSTRDEQRAIATALSDVDALLDAQDKLIAKKRDIKQAAMQELFRPKEGWRIEKLEKIADVIDPHPSHRAPPEVPNGIAFVGIGDLSEDGEIIGSKLRTVASSVFEEHQIRYNLDEGLIGLGRVASIGKVVKLKDVGVKFAVSPTLGVIRGTKVRREYLLHALKSRYVTDQFSRIMSGSTRSSVGMVVLRRLDIPLPNLDAEQSSIATILSDMDVEIAALEKERDKTRAIKQGMMQELLTGRIRLVNEETRGA